MRLILLLPILCLGHLAAAEIVAQRAPNNGIQPQAMVGSDGSIHLITYVGPEAAGNLLYFHREPGAANFSEPIAVNSVPGSAVAMGSVRGAHLALGRTGQVYVSWMGSGSAPKGPNNSTPMLFARLPAPGQAFEAQRNVLTWADGLDGGGTLAADDAGHVVVAWQAGPKQVPEPQRSVYIAASQDDGATFGKEVQAITDRSGACACCGMRAGVSGEGGLYVLYRRAKDGLERDMVLASASQIGKPFRTIDLESWKLKTCPMSTAAIAPTSDGVLIAWEGGGGLKWMQVTKQKAGMARILASTGAKHPAIARAADGTIAIVWTEGMAWKRGGSLHWQLFAADGSPLGEPGQQDGVPAWSIPTVVALPDGNFAAWY